MQRVVAYFYDDLDEVGEDTISSYDLDLSNVEVFRGSIENENETENENESASVAKQILQLATRSGRRAPHDVKVAQVSPLVFGALL